MNPLSPGIQVYNPKDGSNRLLQGKIVRIYDSLSEAQRDFRSLMKRGHKIHGQRLFGLEKLLPFAQQALPYQRIGFMSDIFRGVPALQQTFSSQQKSYHFLVHDTFRHHLHRHPPWD